MNDVTDWLTQLWRRTVVLPVLLHLARRDLARGRLARAKARFLRCTQLVPFSFQAHFGLACIYLRERDYSRAQRELLLAKEIAPARYRECKERLPELVGLLDSGFSDAPGGSTSQQILPGSVSTASAVEDGWPESRLPGGVPDLVQPGSLPQGSGGPRIGDCRDRGEWIKFRRMGPISEAEVATVDWDHVVSELQRRDS